MALDLGNNYFVFPSYQPSMDWDPHCTDSGAGDDLHEQFMPLAMESPASSQASTGYLQDAVAEWSDRCKRRRVANFSPVHDSTTTAAAAAATAAGELQDLLQEFWDSNCYGDPSRGLNYLLQEEFIIPDDPFGINNLLTATAPQLPHHRPLSSSSSYDEEELINVMNLRESADAKPSIPAAPKVMKTLSTFRECDRRRFKKNKAKTAAAATVTVVYPFAVVKPGGFEGDVTLDDINARLLRRPRRPVRHPVGEFAGGPRVGAGGPGLSGKAVVSLTRIQTQGRGTITIIRTRG